MNATPPITPGKPPIIPPAFMVPFILITTLFALWGFANDITNPMVAAFKNILLISHFESSLVQFAFYGGYCFMAIPAALFIKRFSYQRGILMGLALYAIGCLLFLPSGQMMQFWAFLLAYFVMTCGLAFLETSANPYILSMGPEESATRRLNLAQAFNPMGSIIGMFIAKDWILAKLDPRSEEQRRALSETDPAAFAELQRTDLSVIVGPYLTLGLVVLAVFVVFALYRFPQSKTESSRKLDLAPTLRRLLANPRYREGVIAQGFYVGVQIMCWTFIIQYGVNELGLTKEAAQGYNIIAMVIFVSSRFICTFLLKFVSAGGLLLALALAGAFLTLGVIFVQGMTGLYCLVALSACMSLMFPTIYGIALRGMGEDAKLASAGLILAIGGGCLMPPWQAAIMDLEAFQLGPILLSSTRVSFVLPLLCFAVIALFGWRTLTLHDTAQAG
jgi:FHS family L-fucose permease-like MFS transporter